MSLVEYAESELRRVGLFDKDSDYDGMLGKAALEIVKVFADQGHSGFSAAMTTGLVEKLMRFEPLSPLTGDEDEWVVLDYDDHMYAQNKRCFRVFQRRDGTAYDTEGRVHRYPDGVTYVGPNVDVTFPYTPKTEVVDVPFDDDWNGEER